jgi:hypothetical protein
MRRQSPLTAERALRLVARLFRCLQPRLVSLVNDATVELRSWVCTVSGFTNVRRGNCSVPLPGLRGLRTLTEGQQHYVHTRSGRRQRSCRIQLVLRCCAGCRRPPSGPSRSEGSHLLSNEDRLIRHHQAVDGKAATHANGGTIGFACASAEQVKAFHDAGVAYGGKNIEDPPGWREGAVGKFYLAYLRDLSDNKICAVRRG